MKKWLSCYHSLNLGQSQGANLSNKDLKDAGLKVTAPRLKILEILQSKRNEHLSAEDLYKVLLDQGEDVGLATVYRVLTQFESAGLVMRHNFEGGRSVFELEDGEHHDHIVCVKCGHIEEFYDDVIEERQKQMAAKLGFEITDHDMYLYGLCPKCKS